MPKFRKLFANSVGLRSLAPMACEKSPSLHAAKYLSLHSNYMLNQGYAYTTRISSKYHGQTLLSHLASLYPHSTPRAWRQKLNNGEVTLDGVTASGSESITLGQTLNCARSARSTELIGEASGKDLVCPPAR